MPLKSKRVRDLAAGLVDRVADLLQVDLGDDVEAGHATPGSTGRGLLRTRPGSVPEWPKGTVCKTVAKATLVRIQPGPPLVSEIRRPGGPGVRTDSATRPATWSILVRMAGEASSSTIVFGVLSPRLGARRLRERTTTTSRTPTRTTYFKVPNDWKLYDEDAVLPGHPRASLSPHGSRDLPRARAGPTAFDSEPATRRPEATSTRRQQAPAGFARCRTTSASTSRHASLAVGLATSSPRSTTLVRRRRRQVLDARPVRASTGASTARTSSSNRRHSTNGRVHDASTRSSVVDRRHEQALHPGPRRAATPATNTTRMRSRASSTPGP